MAAAAGPMSVAAAGLSAGSSIMGGFMRGRADAAAGESSYLQGMQGAMQSALAAGVADLKATQTDMALRERLGSTLANISAMAASANLDSRSPTTTAIYNRTEGMGMQADAIMQSNLHFQSSMLRSASVMQAMGAQNALAAGYANDNTDIINGFLGAGGSLLKSFAGFKWGS